MGVKFGEFTLTQFGKEKFGEWIDQAKIMIVRWT